MSINAAFEALRVLQSVQQTTTDAHDALEHSLHLGAIAAEAGATSNAMRSYRSAVEQAHAMGAAVDAAGAAVSLASMKEGKRELQIADTTIQVALDRNPPPTDEVELLIQRL